MNNGNFGRDECRHDIRHFAQFDRKPDGADLDDESSGADGVELDPPVKHELSAAR
jgi:hypothetical protein